MRHAMANKKLNRTSEHRKALLMNMLNSLIKYEQIKTTLPKAKFLKPQAEKIITIRVVGSKIRRLLRYETGPLLDPGHRSYPTASSRPQVSLLGIALSKSTHQQGSIDSPQP